MAKRVYKRGAEPRVSHREAVVALEENTRKISAHDEVIWNLNLALIYLVRAVDQISRDVELLHNRI